MPDMNENNILQIYSQLDPLKEIWIGDTYPEAFYKNFDRRTQDIFGQITNITKKELNKLCTKLQELGVRVVRPRFEDKIDHYIDARDRLIKPPICPADWAITIGKTLFILPQYYSGIEPFQHAIDSYKSNNQNIVILKRNELLSYLIFPSITRLGKDLFIDYPNIDPSYKEAAILLAEKLQTDYRVHLSDTGDHSDGVFCPLKDKQLMTNRYRSKYGNTFPGWNVHHIKIKRKNPSHNFKWWLPGDHFASFNNEIIKVANDWLGNPWESIFNVNNIVVDDKNIIVSERDERSIEHLESIGFNVHVINLDTQYFWDSGLHCLSADIFRQGDLTDYWPNRGNNGIYYTNE